MINHDVFFCVSLRLFAEKCLLLFQTCGQRSEKELHPGLLGKVQPPSGQTRRFPGVNRYVHHPVTISVTSDWASDTQPHKSWEEKAVVFKSYGASVFIRMWWMRRDVWKKKWSSWRKWTEQRRHDSLTRFQSRRLTGKKFNDSNIYSIFLYFVLSELVLIWCMKLLWVYENIYHVCGF